MSMLSGRKKKKTQQPPSAGQLDAKMSSDFVESDNRAATPLHNGFELKRMKKKTPSFSKRPHIYTIHVLKRNEEVGLEIAGGRGSKYGHVGIYVAGIVAGSNVERDGHVRTGDQILAINNNDVGQMSITEVADLLKKSGHVVRLTLGSKYPVKGGSTDSLLQLQQELKPLEPSSPSFVYDIMLRKDSSGRGLGFSIMDGASIGKRGIFVKEVFQWGEAAQDGTLRKGDEIVQVNNEPFTNVSFMEAMSVIKSARPGYVKLKIRRRKLPAERSQSASTMETGRQVLTNNSSFKRQGSDRSIHRGQPLYSRNRKPPCYVPPEPEPIIQPIRNVHLPMTSSLNRLQRHQSTDSTESYSSVDSFTSAPLMRNRTKSPIPRMGVSVKRRIQEDREKMALQRRSQSENDLSAVYLYDNGPPNLHSSTEGLAGTATPTVLVKPKVSYKPSFEPIKQGRPSDYVYLEESGSGFKPVDQDRENFKNTVECESGLKSVKTVRGSGFKPIKPEWESGFKPVKQEWESGFKPVKQEWESGFKPVKPDWESGFKPVKPEWERGRKPAHYDRGPMSMPEHFLPPKPPIPKSQQHRDCNNIMSVSSGAARNLSDRVVPNCRTSDYRNPTYNNGRKMSLDDGDTRQYDPRTSTEKITSNNNGRKLSLPTEYDYAAKELIALDNGRQLVLYPLSYDQGRAPVARDYEEPVPSSTSTSTLTNNRTVSMPKTTSRLETNPADSITSPRLTRLNKPRLGFNLPGSLSSLDGCDVTPEAESPVFAPSFDQQTTRRVPVTHSTKYEYV